MQGDAHKHLFRGHLAENMTADSYKLSFFQLTNTIAGHSEELPHFLLTGSCAAKAKKRRSLSTVPAAEELPELLLSLSRLGQFPHQL